MTAVRNEYLIGRSIKSYFLATMLSSFATTLGVVVDGIIVGNFVGSTALVAVNLCVPLIQLMSAVTILLNVGGAMMTAASFGKMDIQSSKTYFSMSVFLTVGVSIAFALLGFFFCDEIVAVLCTDATLRPLVKEYASVVLVSAPLYFAVPGLCVFIRTDSNPRLSTLVLLTANVCNLVFDLILINVFSMGVLGSAVASSLGYVVGLAIALTHFKRKNSILKLHIRFHFKKLGEILLAGLPVALASALMTVRLLTVNGIILRTLGSDGMGIMAVCFNVLMLASMFVGGTAQSLQPIGGILYGGQDYSGLKIALKMTFKVLATSIGAIVLALLLFPGIAAGLFGLESTAYTSSVIRTFALCLPLFAASYVLMVNYQIIRMKTLSIFISCAQSLMVIPVMLVITRIDSGLLWYSFALGELLVLLMLLLLSALFRRKTPAASRVTLIPADPPNTCNFSVEAKEEYMESAADKIRTFFEKTAVNPDLPEKLYGCCKEHMKNILANGYKTGKKHFIDIILQDLPEKQLAIIKDDGTALEASGSEGESPTPFQAASSLCDSFDYVLIAGQNVASMAVHK